ncbi:hypothetical protein [Streptomyces rhizosphaericus]|uniref:Uncharacterized protein n=1 Tax=Streptomyces rhizosphaericus TaxID=114699 RepID=A0A6G4AJ10_9ACTN|nr:hypothetical protein [Streptomyces rhizosphaericus]NEW72621.1 hypothetical protein [Streptomyces rhizosphaericus]
MSTPSGNQPSSYWAAFEWWQARLASVFFGEDHRDTPVLFFIDRSELRALRGENEAGELGAAVSSALAWHERNPYTPVVDRCRSWRRGKREDPPPCLPLLAAAVLAAANMQRKEGGAGAPAYYARLAEVLQPPWGGGQHRKPLENHYAAIVDQWGYLDEWLREQAGARGLSTIKENPTYRKIGYAQSQALVRAADHAALIRFFLASGLSPSQPTDGARLLEKLKGWSVINPRGLSQGLRAALHSPAESHLLEPLLATLLESWDGTPAQDRIDGTLLQVPLRVVLEEDFMGWEVRWHAEAVRGVDRDSLRHPGGTLELASGAGDQAYALSGAIPGVVQALQRGFTARGAKAAVRIDRGRDVLALREDPVAGGWMETDVVTVFEPYLFLFTRSGRSRLQKLLADTGHQWYRPEAAPLQGWHATPELQFTDESVLAEALSRSGIQNIRHVPGRRLSLRNGLRVQQGWNHRSLFLLGGEPDVMVPQEFREPGRVTLDGQPLAVPADGLVVLRGRGLTPGRHVLTADGAEADFYLEQGAEPQAGSPADSASGTPSGAVTVSLDGDARFLTAQGRFLTLRRPPEPAWWKHRAPVLHGGGTALVPVPPEAVWLVVISETGTPDVALLRPQDPDFGTLSRAAKDFWSKIALFDLTGVPHATLWKRYREAALSQFPRGGFTRV